MAEVELEPVRPDANNATSNNAKTGEVLIDMKGKQSSEKRCGKNFCNLTRCLIFAALLFVVIIVIVVTVLVVLKPWHTKSKLQIEFENAAVSADHEICSKIGVDILKQNGSAVDAAIATALCGCSIHFHSCGLGGGLFMVIYDKSTNQTSTIDAREVAPLAANSTMYEGLPEGSSLNGGLAIAVPGQIAGYWLAHQKYGRIPWKDLFTPTVELLKNGFPISEITIKYIKNSERNMKNINQSEYFRDILLDSLGNLKEAGEIITLCKLSETLDVISNARNADELFYEGTLASTLVEDMQNSGSIITINDLKMYKALEKDPITIDLGKYRLVTTTGPSGGPVVAMILGIIEQFNFTSESIATIDAQAKTIHVIVESFKFAYGAGMHLGDPDKVDGVEAFIESMVSDEVIKWVTNHINETTSTDYKNYNISNYQKASPTGTSHLSVLSPDGSAVSLTTSLNTFAGSFVVSPSTGIIFNNEMDDFSQPGKKNAFDLAPSDENFIEPGKRPQSSMSPVLVLDENDDVVMVLGGAGGSRIISAVSQVIIDSLFFGMDIKESVDCLRIHHQLLPMTLQYEEGLDLNILSKLVERGHKIRKLKKASSNVQAIFRTKEGIIQAYSDPRKGGVAAGF